MVVCVSVYNEGGRNRKYVTRIAWRNEIIIGGEEKLQKGNKGGEITLMNMIMIKMIKMIMVIEMTDLSNINRNQL